MKQLIVRYESGVRARIVEIVRAVTAQSAKPPSYVYALTAVKTLPPIMYPTVMLNAAVNYRAHGAEMQRAEASPQLQNPTGPPPGTAPPGTQTIAGIWERTANDTRWNPYMFLKSPAAIIAEGEAIRLPRGRTRVDWECELGVVVGTAASYVPVAQAGNAIFGYTMQLDVSDREARGDGRYGSDWLIAKNHDTFAPLGAFITPKEFVRDPKNLRVTFTLNGQVMQDANTSLMIHDVFELVSSRVQHHDPSSRRRPVHRHARRRGLGPHAADLPEGRRQDELHVRGHGDADEHGDGTIGVLRRTKVRQAGYRRSSNIRRSRRKRLDF